VVANAERKIKFPKTKSDSTMTITVAADNQPLRLKFKNPVFRIRLSVAIKVMPIYKL